MVASQPATSLKLFYSYSHKDEELRDELENHLAMLKRDRVISDWHDRRISAGQEWDGKIDEHLNSAEIILLLVSSDFLASNYCYDLEVKRAMERHEAGDARVIPVILRASDWNTAPFAKLQALPKDGIAVKLWPDPDVAFLDIAKGIRRAAAEMTAVGDAEDDAEEKPTTPDPHLLIPELRVDFVERRDQSGKNIVTLLREELLPNRPRLVALWGAGGVGKTAIAAEAARGLIETFGNRVVWLSADGLVSFNLTTLLDGISSQLGYPDLRKLPLELKKDHVRDLVKTAPTFVVLDNFETIEPQEGTSCVQWLGYPAPCSTLITTRDVIEGARNIPINVMRPEEAQNLLTELINQTHDERAFAKLDRNRLIDIAEANPLVLQWIVGQIDLAQDPSEVLDDLRHGEGTAAERVFSRSFELKQLDNGGRAVLLALSLFTPSSTRKALAEVSGLGKANDKKRFKEAVRSLSALWLIHTTDESQRLAVEGLTRELTKARLQADPRGKTFRPRFVSRFVSYAKRHPNGKAEDYEALEIEKDNLFSAADVALALKDSRNVMTLAYLFVGMLNVRGYWDDALRLGRMALSSAKIAHSEYDIAAWSHNIASMHQGRGEIVQAQTLYNDSLKIKRELGNQLGIATTLHELGRLAHSQGDIPQARRLYDESLEISRAQGGHTKIAGTLHNLAVIAQHQGEIDEARELYRESLEIAKDIGDDNGVAKTLHQLANLASDQGELDEARRLYNESLHIEQRFGNQQGLASSFQALGRLEEDQGNPAEARRLFDESLKISKKLGNLSGIADALGTLGELVYHQGKFAEAHGLFDGALEIAKKLGDQSRIASSLQSLANIARDRGKLDEARSLIEEALKISKHLGEQKLIACSLQSLAEIASDRGELDEARRLYEESLKIEEKLGSQNGIAATQHQLGTLDLAESSLDAAEWRFEESLNVFRKLHYRMNEAECLESIGKLRLCRGEVAAAETLYVEALAIAEQIGNQFRVASVKHSLGILAEQDSDRDRATNYFQEALTIFEELGSPKASDLRRALQEIEARTA